MNTRMDPHLSLALALYNQFQFQQLHTIANQTDLLKLTFSLKQAKIF